MSRFHGPQRTGASRELRELKRIEAKERATSNPTAKKLLSEIFTAGPEGIPAEVLAPKPKSKAKDRRIRERNEKGGARSLPVGRI